MNRLITIPMSHYCEKARWALEWCSVPYVEERHLQGFHYIHSFRTAKSPTVPILKTSERILTDSTDIIKWCDTQALAERKLRPANEIQQQEIDKLEDYFDETLGVSGRLWMYTYMLDEIPTILKYSKLQKVPGYQTSLMPLIFPLIKNRLHQRLNLTSKSRTETKKIVDEVFVKVADQLQGRRYLVGDKFTSADLTFAALSAAVLIPDDYGVPLPKLDELPEEMQKQVEVWREHPAGQFARRMYKENRYR